MPRRNWRWVFDDHGPNARRRFDGLRRGDRDLRPGPGSGGARRTRHRHQDVLRLPDRLRCRTQHPGLPDLPGVPRRDAGGQPHRGRVRDPDRAGAELRDRHLVPVRPEELLLSGHAEELPDLAVRRAASPPTGTWTSRSTGRPCGWRSSAPTWRRTPASPPTSAARPAGFTEPSTRCSTTTGPVSRWSRSSPSPSSAPRRSRPQVARAYVTRAPGSAVLAGCLGRQDGPGLAALRRERLAHPGREPGVRHPHRDQERQLAALGGTGGALRDHPAGSASRHRRPDRPGDKALRRVHRDDLAGPVEGDRGGLPVLPRARPGSACPGTGVGRVDPGVAARAAVDPAGPHAGRLGADRPADARPAGLRRAGPGGRDRGGRGRHRRRPPHGGRPTWVSRPTPAASR